MSDFKEGPQRYSLKENERVVMITRGHIKEIFKWTSALKEKNPYVRSQGESIVELLRQNLSPVSTKETLIVLTTDEIKTILWWQELSGVKTETTESTLLLLKNARDKIKPPTAEKTEPSES